MERHAKVSLFGVPATVRNKADVSSNSAALHLQAGNMHMDTTGYTARRVAEHDVVAGNVIGGIPRIFM